MRSKLTSKQSAFAATRFRQQLSGGLSEELQRKQDEACYGAQRGTQAHEKPQRRHNGGEAGEQADVVMVEKTIADRKEVLETLTQIMRESAGGRFQQSAGDAASCRLMASLRSSKRSQSH